MMIIRQFQPSDFEEIVSIETGLFQKSDPLNYISLYEISREGFLVAEVEKKTVGFAAGYPVSDSECRIFSIAVRSDYQGQGIGTHLICSLINLFYRNLIRYVSLEVRADNHRARRLYRRLGFIPCWTEKNYYPDGEDAIFMKKILPPSDSVLLS
ncbi:ribosomal-protein-alanine acetyltransferase [Methanosalsum zhilinae DSM 4017]|uniref:Ribosomal-protein-alanine acetyltransferase n=1 Tax=Methanosalsum zhilinae (strain DSM 4017 / NBRC 107636 / OCM 62 / WeN5) TaxID=679901 RepID=F7XMI6_METZD|nr:ribosomal protein S18-alanine N-acetyltransferase [Methanosalsum zhilinae]AEH59909.1 ribosomal-protein-alanine acetyltransferase [Methanosalsum zhilinae DSM 4017]